MRSALLLIIPLMNLSVVNQPANSWRGLVPLHSSCEDVKRILKVQKCESPPFEYSLPGYRVMIEFENESCAHNSRAWRVPLETVTGMILSPKSATRPSELSLDLSVYEKHCDDEIEGLVHYERRQDGISFDLFNGFIQTIFLYPRRDEEKMRCSLSIPSDRPSSAVPVRDVKQQST